MEVRRDPSELRNGRPSINDSKKSSVEDFPNQFDEYISFRGVLKGNAGSDGVPILNLEPHLYPPAIRVHKFITRYISSKAGIDVSNRNKEIYVPLKKILELSIKSNSQELLDEIYMQIIIIIYNGIDEKKIVRAFELLILSLASFPPSQILAPAVDSFLNSVVKNCSRIYDKASRSWASSCRFRLKHILTLGRRLSLPSDSEINCIIRRERFHINVSLSNGSLEAHAIDSWTTVGELRTMVQRSLGMKDNLLFAIYRVVNNNDKRTEKRLRDGECIMHSGGGGSGSGSGNDGQIVILEDEVVRTSSSITDCGWLRLKLGTQRQCPTSSASLVYRSRSVIDLGIVVKSNEVAVVEMLYLQALRDTRQGFTTGEQDDHVYLAALACQELYGMCPLSREDGLLMVREQLHRVAPPSLIEILSPTARTERYTLGITGDVDRDGEEEEEDDDNDDGEEGDGDGDGDGFDIDPLGSSFATLSPSHHVHRLLFEKFCSLVLAQWTRLPSTLTRCEAMAVYLDYVRGLEGYGMRCFPVTPLRSLLRQNRHDDDCIRSMSLSQPPSPTPSNYYGSDSEDESQNSMEGRGRGGDESGQRVVVVDRHGVTLLDSFTRDIINYMSFTDIMAWGFDGSTWALRYRNREDHYQTLDGEEICKVLEVFYRKYCNVHRQKPCPRASKSLLARMLDESYMSNISSCHSPTRTRTN